MTRWAQWLATGHPLLIAIVEMEREVDREIVASLKHEEADDAVG